jgi:sugar lactone lactonase YvrE
MAAHDLRTLLDGFSFGEGPRWRAGALWFSDMHGHRVLRVVTDGHEKRSVETVVEITDDDPSGLGWLPDGRLLVVAMESQQLRRVEADGTVVVHADLSSAARGDLNDMIVGVDGTAYVGDMGARIQSGGEMVPGQTFRVAPDGTWAQAADDLQAPNGHVLTDDGHTLIVAESGRSRLTAFAVGADGTLSGRRTFAELVPGEGSPIPVAPPDGICLDAEGAVWVADPIGRRVFRVREGGEVTDSVAFPDAVPVACVLGGDDRRTLMMCVADDWKREALAGRQTGRIVTTAVDVPGAGRP